MRHHPGSRSIARSADGGWAKGIGLGIGAVVALAGLPLLSASHLLAADLLYQERPSPALDQAWPPGMLQPRRLPALAVNGPRVLPGEAEEILARRRALAALPTMPPSSATTITPELQELARGLRGDPRLIFELVRNSIEYVPMYGSVKGATMTFLDRRGNDFDQASLFIALMRASGYTASYVYGRIQLTGAQVESWLGLPDDANVVAGVLWDGGIPSDVWTNGSGGVSSVQVDHVWAKATIGGTDYVFDPSFKSHTLVGGIDLAGAMGYDRATFLARATQGMTSDPNYVKNVNRANIRADITALATSLANHISATDSGMTLAQVIGGQSIVAERNAPYRTSLPYEIARTYTWTDIPDAYQTTLRIRHIGIDVTLKTVDFYGKRLTIAYSGGSPTYIPVLVLDGAQIAFGNSTSTFFNPCELNVDHPYAGGGGAYGDDDATVYPGAGGIYYFSTSWGGTGRLAIEKRRRALDEYLAQGLGNTSEPVMGETLAMIGLSWMAETTRAAELGDRIDQTVTILHHELGIVGQLPGQSVFMDMPMSMAAVTSETGDNARTLSRQYVRSGVNSGFEWAAIDQLQPISGVSTIRLLDMANAQGYKIFDATAANWSGAGGVRANLVGYDANGLASIDAYIGAGYRVILPERGNLQQNQYHGVGYIVIGPGGSSIANMVYGQLYGGFGDTIWIVNPDGSRTQMKLYPESFLNPSSKDPVDYQTGALQHRSLDLALGTGVLPFGLAFETSYLSSARRADGPLGRGWSHNWNLAATKANDGFRAMGDATPGDASAAIVELYVTSDLLRAGLAKDRVAIATITHRFLMDTLIDNMVNVSTPGETYQFLKRADGTYSPPPGRWAQLVWPGDGSATLTTRHGDVVSFNTDGKLTSWHDPNGNTLTLARDASKRLSSVTNGMGKTLSFSYNAQNRITAVSEGTGRSVGYGYDTDGHLVSMTDPLGHAVRFEYDSGGRLARIFKPSAPATPLVSNAYDDFDRMKTQTNAGGGVTSFYYGGDRSEEVDPVGGSHVLYFDARGNLVLDIDGAGNRVANVFDGQDRVVGQTLPQGNGYEYGYDSKHDRVLKNTLPKPGSNRSPIVEHWTWDASHSRPTSYTDGRGQTTAFTLDSKGNLVRTDLPAGGGPARTLLYTSNARGQEVSRTDAGGFVTTTTYDPASAELVSTTFDPTGLDRTTSFVRDARGDAISKTDPRGLVWTYEYDANRRLTKEVAPAPLSFQTLHSYDVDGNLVETRRQTGDAVNPWQISSRVLTLDALVASEIDPLGRTSTRQYDSCRRLWKATNADGKVTEFHYDVAGRLSQVIGPTGTVLEERTYTSSGREAAARDANGNTTTVTYDDFDRVAQVVAPGGRSTSYLHEIPGDADSVTRKVDALGGVTTSTYDSLGRRLRVTDPDGVYSDFTYDLRGLIATETTSLGHVTQYSYDAAANRTAVADNLGNTWSYAYDEENRTLAGTNQAGGTSTWIYDELGRQTSESDPMGRTVQRHHDPLGRLDTVTAPDDGVVQMSYDLAGNRVAYTDPLGHQWSFAYDTLSREQSSTAPDGAAESYTYDALGRETQRTLRDGKVINNTYDANGQLTGVSLPAGEGEVSYVYDEAGNVTSASDTQGTTSWTYDALNRKKSVTDPHGATVAFAYTPAGRLASVTYPGGHAVTYEYDSGGRLEHVSDWAGGVTTLSYDGADRLVQIQFPNGLKRKLQVDQAGRTTSLRHERSEGTLLLGYQLVYNAAGQVTSRTKTTSGAAAAPPPEATTFTYDAVNRLATKENGGATRSYTFDPRGNLVSWTQGTAGAEFSYDSRNRLVESSQATLSVENEFGALGERIAKSVNGAETRYLADGGTVYCLLSSANVVRTYFIYGPDLLYGIDASGGRLVYLPDPKGSIEGIVDGGQNLVQSYDYSPQGTLTAVSGGLSNDFRFVGTHGVSTDENGLYLMRARFYDPDAGRFVAEDPLGLLPGPNVYEYGNGDPVNRIDPEGLLARYGLKTKEEKDFARMMTGDPNADMDAWYAKYQNVMSDKEQHDKESWDKCKQDWKDYWADVGRDQTRAYQGQGMIAVDSNGKLIEGTSLPGIEVAGNAGVLSGGIARDFTTGKMYYAGGIGFAPLGKNDQNAWKLLNPKQLKSDNYDGVGFHIAIIIPAAGVDMKDVLPGTAYSVEGGNGFGGGVIFNSSGEPVATKIGYYTPGASISGGYGATDEELKPFFDAISSGVQAAPPRGIVYPAGYPK